MDYEEKRDLIRHIRLGTDEVLYYPYGEGTDPLPVRPLSSYELDQCYYKALEGAPSGVANFVVKIKMGMIKKDMELGDIDNQNYKRLIEFYDAIDYWIVYYGMKDFQGEDFQKPDYDKIEGYPQGYYIIKEKMEDVHHIANYIKDASHRPKDVVKELFKDEMGREVAMKVTYLKQPLADIDKLTKLQEDYLIYSEGNLEKILEAEAKAKNIIRSDTPIKVRELLARLPG